MQRHLRRLASSLLAVAVLLSSTGLASAAPAGDAVPDKGKPIDIVLCLDVSGSMNGLIESAKNKLWDIVNDLAKIKPTPELRVGLYSYGHSTYSAQAGWVRKEADLTGDLDEVYRKLNALTINGGSELVARVTRDAIDQQQWSTDKHALRIVFVCGNEAADQDKEVTLASVAGKAKEKDIVVNTIFCGSVAHRDSNGWKDFAVLAKGQFFSIDQNRATVVINTPFDQDIAKLSADMSKTYVAYGAAGKEKAENQKAQDANALKQAPAVAAARAESKNSAFYRNDGWCLVDRMKNDKTFDLKKIAVEDLPEEMKKMTPEEREAHLKKKLVEREAMQKQIAELTAKRQAYIKEESKKSPDKADQAFDAAVRGALRQQAEVKGIKIPE